MKIYLSAHHRTTTTSNNPTQKKPKGRRVMVISILLWCQPHYIHPHTELHWPRNAVRYLKSLEHICIFTEDKSRNSAWRLRLLGSQGTSDKEAAGLNYRYFYLKTSVTQCGDVYSECCKWIFRTCTANYHFRYFCRSSEDKNEVPLLFSYPGSLLVLGVHWYPKWAFSSAFSSSCSACCWFHSVRSSWRHWYI